MLRWLLSDASALAGFWGSIATSYVIQSALQVARGYVSAQVFDQFEIAVIAVNGLMGVSGAISWIMDEVILHS